MLSEFDPLLWSRRKSAIERIFAKVGSLDGVIKDSSENMPGVVMKAEAQDFKDTVEDFHRRMSRTVTTNNKPSSRGRLHVVSEHSRSPRIHYAFYDLGEVAVSHLIYQGVGTRGTPVVGDRINVFGHETLPFEITNSLTRANFDIPGRTRGSLYPVSINTVPHELFELHTQLDMAGDAATTASSDVKPPILRAIEFEPGDPDQ